MFAIVMCLVLLIMYLDHLKFCVVCINGRRCICFSLTSSMRTPDLTENLFVGFIFISTLHSNFLYRMLMRFSIMYCDVC